MFIPFCVGTIFAASVYIVVDPVLGFAATKKTRAGAYPESRRLPPAYLGGFIIVLALFLMGYCIGNKVHFGYPLFLEGMFGCGFLLIFIGLTNYIVDAYQVRCFFSLFGAAWSEANPSTIVDPSFFCARLVFR